MFLSYFVLTRLSGIGYNSTQPLGILLRKVFYHEQEPLPAGRSRPPRLCRRHLRNRRRLGLAGCSDTSAEADKGSAASSKSSEDTELPPRSTPRHSTSSSTTAPRPMTMPSPPAPGPRPSRTPASLRSVAFRPPRSSPSSTRKTVRPAASMPVSHSSCPTTFWARTRSRSRR